MSLNTFSEIIQFAIDREETPRPFTVRPPAFRSTPGSRSFLRSWPMRNKNMKKCWKVWGRWSASRKPRERCRT